jgi:hypothetical protein
MKEDVMSRKSMYLFSVSVLLMILLVLSGCPASTGSDTESDPGIPPQEVPSSSSTGGGSTLPIPEPIKVDVTEITTALNKSAAVNGKLESAGAPVVIGSDAGTPPTISADTNTPLVVPANKVLELDNVTLEVPNAVTATTTVAGTLNVGNKAKLDVKAGGGGPVVISGSVTAADGGVVDFSTVAATSGTRTITLSGTLTIAKGGTYYSPATDPLNPDSAPQFVYEGTGKIVFQSGSTAYLNVGGTNIVQIGPAIAAGDPFTNSPIYEWGAGAGSVELTDGGVITLKSGTLLVKGIPIPPSDRGTPPIQTAVVDSGATLKILGVTTGPGLLVNKALTVNGALVADGLIVGGTNTSKITFGRDTSPTGAYILTAGTANFYKSGGSTPVAVPADLQGKEFTWNGADKWVETP